MKSNLVGPIFVLGFPRSGTSGLASGLSKLPGFANHGPEGHFIYLFNDPITRIREDRLNPNNILRDPAAKAVFFDAIARGVDDVYRAASGATSKMWIDKTPDIDQVRAIPTIRTLFPNAWFCYIYRDPVSSVRSNMATWPDQLEGKEIEVAERWRECQAMWRKVSASIPDGKKIEIFQPELRKDPEKVVGSIAKIMDLDANQADFLTQFWTANRQMNRPNDGDLAKTYDAFTLDDEIISKVIAATNGEVAHWPRLKAKAKQ